ncbi:MAG TPA: hypothetical protein VGC36_09080 [Rhizomicrobium sp.]
MRLPGDTMKAKVLVRVDRDAALEAIRALDALGDALREVEPNWPKPLKRKYKDARRELVHAIGYAADFSGIADCAVID